MTLDLALKLQPIFAAAFALGFVLIYAFKGKWWKSAIGRHMMTFMAGVLVVLLIGVTVRFFPNLENIKQVRFWSWNIVILLMGWRFWLAFQVFILKNYSDFAEQDAAKAEKNE